MPTNNEQFLAKVEKPRRGRKKMADDYLIPKRGEGDA